jgi:hypothetical protein
VPENCPHATIAQAVFFATGIHFVPFPEKGAGFDFFRGGVAGPLFRFPPQRIPPTPSFRQTALSKVMPLFCFESIHGLVEVKTLFQ